VYALGPICTGDGISRMVAESFAGRRSSGSTCTPGNFHANSQTTFECDCDSPVPLTHHLLRRESISLWQRRSAAYEQILCIPTPRVLVPLDESHICFDHDHDHVYALCQQSAILRIVKTYNGFESHTTTTMDGTTASSTRSRVTTVEDVEFIDAQEE
jgi:hypothetical protein